MVWAPCVCNLPTHRCKTSHFVNHPRHSKSHRAGSIFFASSNSGFRSNNWQKLVPGSQKTAGGKKLWVVVEPTHLKNMFVKLDHSPRKDEHWKMKPPRTVVLMLGSWLSFVLWRFLANNLGNNCSPCLRFTTFNKQLLSHLKFPLSTSHNIHPHDIFCLRHVCSHSQAPTVGWKTPKWPRPSSNSVPIPCALQRNWFRLMTSNGKGVICSGGDRKGSWKNHCFDEIILKQNWDLFVANLFYENDQD